MSCSKTKKNLDSQKEKKEPCCHVFSFFIWGLINNFGYSIVLCASKHILGNNLPSGVILCADIIPTFIISMVSPFFIHRMGRVSRILTVVIAAIFGFIFVGLSTYHWSLGIIGVILHSFSSGFGQVVSFAVSIDYTTKVISGWSAGTGFSGLSSSALFAVLNTMNVPYDIIMYSCSPLPLIMLLCYYLINPHKSPGHENDQGKQINENKDLENNNIETLEIETQIIKLEEDEVKITESSNNNNNNIEREIDTEKVNSNQNIHNTDKNEIYEEEDDENKPLIDKSINEKEIDHVDDLHKRKNAYIRSLTFAQKLKLLKPTTIFIISLFLVYAAEYSINQGVSAAFKFKGYEESYYTYAQVCYQAGVFISRSSLPVFKMKPSWTVLIPSILQVFFLIFYAINAKFYFIDGYAGYITFLALSVIEGLWGGLVFVNANYWISMNSKAEAREFNLSCANFFNSCGIAFASIIASFVEMALKRPDNQELLL